MQKEQAKDTPPTDRNKGGKTGDTSSDNKASPKQDSKAATRLVGIHYGTPFDVALVTAIPLSAAQGTALRDLVVDGATVIAKGSTVTGKISKAARPHIFGGTKMNFRLIAVQAVDGHMYPIRALATRTDNGEKPVESGVKPSGDDTMAGTQYVAYIHDDAVVTVPK